MKSLTKQIGGNHYQKYKYQPTIFGMDTLLMNTLFMAIKYLTRIGVDKDKNGIGIDKSIHYLEIWKDYWITSMSYLMNDRADKNNPHVVQFAEQFDEPVKQIILDICDLDTGFPFLEYDPNIACEPLINPNKLEQAVQNIINKLEQLKETL